jgi:hypothetical protein
MNSKGKIKLLLLSLFFRPIGRQKIDPTFKIWPQKCYFRNEFIQLRKLELSRTRRDIGFKWNDSHTQMRKS